MKNLQLYRIEDFVYNAKLTKASQELLNKRTSNLPVEMMLTYSGIEDKSVCYCQKKCHQKVKR